MAHINLRSLEVAVSSSTAGEERREVERAEEVSAALTDENRATIADHFNGFVDRAVNPEIERYHERIGKLLPRDIYFHPGKGYVIPLPRVDRVDGTPQDDGPASAAVIESRVRRYEENNTSWLGGVSLGFDLGK